MYLMYYIVSTVLMTSVNRSGLRASAKYLNCKLYDPMAECVTQPLIAYSISRQNHPRGQCVTVRHLHHLEGLSLQAEEGWREQLLVGLLVVRVIKVVHVAQF